MNHCRFLPQVFEPPVQFLLHLTAPAWFAYEELRLDVLLEDRREAPPQLARSTSGPTCGLDLANPHQKEDVDGDSKDWSQERAHGWSEVGFWAEKDHGHAHR